MVVRCLGHLRQIHKKKSESIFTFKVQTEKDKVSYYWPVRLYTYRLKLYLIHFVHATPVNQIDLSVTSLIQRQKEECH